MGGERVNESMRRRRALMREETEAGPKNYLVPSSSAGRGSSSASVEEGNILRIITFAKSVDNRIIAWFHTPISLQAGDVVRWVLTKLRGTIASATSIKPMIGADYMSSSYVNLNNGFDVNCTMSSAASASYLCLHNASNQATGTNYVSQTQLYINGKQVI